MPRAGGRQAQPSDYCPDFPDGPVADDAPAGVSELAFVARRLRAELAARGRGITELARTADVDRSTVYDLLAGRAYVDTATLARVERAVGRRLWPRTLARDEP